MTRASVSSPASAEGAREGDPGAAPAPGSPSPPLTSSAPAGDDQGSAVDEAAAAALRARTLTNLYNERPAWLDNLHRELDRAVAAAYGWPEGIATDDALARLLELNLQRSSTRNPAP